jgi:GNAT superfamily N-acetyltransferase
MDVISPKKEDFPFIAQIHNKANQRLLSVYSPEELEAFPETIETVESITETAKTKNILCVKDHNNIPIGYIVFRIKNDCVIWINSLFVNPDFQKKGIGSSLLKAVENFAKNHYIKVVALETHKQAKWAINFYKKNGYNLINDNLKTYPFNQVLNKPPIKDRPLFGKLIECN